MNILGIDTSCGTCSVCIMKDQVIIADIHESRLNLQAEKLMTIIQEALSISKLKYFDIDNIAVTMGPGSFTGIRIGMAAALGIEFAVNAPIIGVSTFESMLHSKEINFNLKAQSMLCLVYAGRNHFYGQEFKEREVSTYKLLSHAEIEQFHNTNSARIITNAAIDGIETIIVDPNAIGTSNAAIFKLKNGFTATNNQEALYIRRPF